MQAVALHQHLLGRGPAAAARSAAHPRRQAAVAGAARVSAWTGASVAAKEASEKAAEDEEFVYGGSDDEDEYTSEEEEEEEELSEEEEEERAPSGKRKREGASRHKKNRQKRADKAEAIGGTAKLDKVLDGHRHHTLQDGTIRGVMAAPQSPDWDRVFAKIDELIAASPNKDKYSLEEPLEGKPDWSSCGGGALNFTHFDGLEDQAIAGYFLELGYSDVQALYCVLAVRSGEAKLRKYGAKAMANAFFTHQAYERAPAAKLKKHGAEAMANAFFTHQDYERAREWGAALEKISGIKNVELRGRALARQAANVAANIEETESHIVRSEMGSMGGNRSKELGAGINADPAGFGRKGAVAKDPNCITGQAIAAVKVLEAAAGPMTSAAVLSEAIKQRFLRVPKSKLQQAKRSMSGLLSTAPARFKVVDQQKQGGIKINLYVLRSAAGPKSP